MTNAARDKTHVNVIKMNKSKTLREYLDIRHPKIWEKLDDNTQEFLEKGGLADISDESCEYAGSHRAAMMTPEGSRFYAAASNDEIQAARENLYQDRQEMNPYQLMCDHNFHILKERYVKAVRMDVETLQEVLDEDTWHEDTDLQKEIRELKNSAHPKNGLDTIVADQLEKRAEFLEEEACHWLEYVEALQK